MNEKRTMTMTEAQAEYDFVGKVAAHYGIARQAVLHAFYCAGKREFLARLRARVLIGRLQAAQEVKEVVETCLHSSAG